jgi:poly(A) polymerase
MKSAMEQTAREIVRKLRTAGHVAYYAGGCVRDLLTGAAPKDIDIATDARPEVVQKLFSRTYAVGAHFGVIVVLENDLQFEVATFRSDGAYIDGRHPVEVHFATAEEDAARRDFTINGMFFDPEKQEVIDFVGGRADLERRLIRAIGESAQRFAEDRLRMLRAVRFATVLGFEIDPATWEAIVASASSIVQISAERIRDELVKIFLSPNRVGPARPEWPDARDPAGSRSDEGLRTATAIPSGRGCVQAHADHARNAPGQGVVAARLQCFVSRCG